MRSTLLLVGLVACGDDPIHHLGDAGSTSNAVPGIYVTLPDTSTVAIFALDAAGDTPPVRTISGPSTGLALPLGIGIDLDGLIYVANRSGAAVTAFTRDASGDATPARTLTATGMRSPEIIAVDADNALYVASCPNCGQSAGGDTAIYHFPAGSSTSDGTISGTAAALTNPGVAVDSDRNIVVSNAFGGTVETFAPGSLGNVPPIRSFTPVGAPNIQSLFTGGGVIALSAPGDGIELFPQSANGDAVPATATIGPSMLPVQYPGGTFLDVSVSPHVLYVVDYTGGAVYVAETSGTGAALTVTSVRTLQGATTTLVHPYGIVVVH